MQLAELPLSQVDLISTVERQHIRVEDPDRVQEAAIEFYDNLKDQIQRILSSGSTEAIEVIYRTDELAVISLDSALASAGFDNLGVDDPELRRAVGCWNALSTKSKMDYTHGGRPGYDSFVVPVDWSGLRTSLFEKSQN